MKLGRLLTLALTNLSNNAHAVMHAGYNFNSEAHTVKAGDSLFGSITFNEANQSYTIYHKAREALPSGGCAMPRDPSVLALQDLTDGWSVSTNIGVEKAKGGGYKVREEVAAAAAA